MISRQDGGDKVCYIQPSDMVTCHQTHTYNYYSGDPLEISMERGRPFKNLFNNRHILRWTFSGQSQQDISWNIPEERRFFVDSKCWGYNGMLYVRQDHLEFLKFLGALTLQSYRKKLAQHLIHQPLSSSVSLQSEAEIYNRTWILMSVAMWCHTQCRPGHIGELMSVLVDHTH